MSLPPVRSDVERLAGVVRAYRSRLFWNPDGPASERIRDDYSRAVSPDVVLELIERLRVAEGRKP